jgi:cytochrome P450
MGRTALLATESHTSDAPVYRGHPLLGAAPDFRRDPFDTLLRAARLGPVVRFRVPPGVPIRSYGLFSPECAQRVLVQETGGYTKDSAPYQEVAAAFGNGLLTAQREEWHRQRRFVAPLFTPRRLEQDYVPTLVAEGTLLRDRWLTAPEATLDVHAASVRYTLRAVGRMLFGADLDPLLPAFGPAFAQLNVHLRQRLTASLLAPRSWPTPGNLRGRKAQRSLYGMVDAIIADRQAAGRSEDDLLGRLLAARHAETGEGLTAGEVRDQVLIFLLAGQETTSTTLAFALQFLALHPQVQRRVAAEAAGVLDGGPPTGDAVRTMPYTQQVVKETMRLYPPAYAVSRYTHDGDVVGGVEILPESNVAVGTFALHRSPQLWPDPNRFDPDRFAPAQVESRHRYAWLPFGAGPRVCIGAQLAMIEATVAIALLTHRHVIVAARRDRPAAPVGAVPAGLVLRPAWPMPYRLVAQR